MRGNFPGRWLIIFLLVFWAGAPAAHAGLTIDFDFSYDTGNFFGANPQAVTALDDAAEFYENYITDNLTAIDPAAQSIIDNGNDTWTATSFNPSNTTANISINNPTIAANTIVVYVGGSATLTGPELGLGGPGGYSDSGYSQTWLNTVAARGQAGALAPTPTDFGPWGGSISFSSTANWYFGTPSQPNVPAGESDFYSVAVHELGHVLGIGTAASFNALISGGNFTGSHAEALNGGNAVPLDPGLAHWAEGTMSDIYGSAVEQEVVMDPSLTTGTRKYVTDLDMAGLSDIGWQVSPQSPTTGSGSYYIIENGGQQLQLVPEPGAWPVVAGVVALGCGMVRRRQS